ncbi:acyl-CoA dehydrogenase NM domain-like protein [Lactarius quietus]|nr:acyl-CoA dehydrogenase NM domain-like protein [Lactarius quietus]
MATSKQLQKLTRDDVTKHNKDGDLWVVIDSKVYDLTRFKNLHPGGAAVLLDDDIAGQDATEAFYSLHRHEVLERPQYQRLQIGYIDGETPSVGGGVGQISKVPYAEPTWLVEGYHSPYYKESHRKLQQAVRKFHDEVIYPDAQAREEDGKRPSLEVIQKMTELNLHAMRTGPGKHLKGLTLMGGIVKPEELIIHQEIGRCGARGYGDGLQAGAIIGLPPVLNFGAPELKARVVPEVLSGKKFICLAISEPFAGSDVTGLKTTAKRTEDGTHWIINGTKKWITNGQYVAPLRWRCTEDGGLTVILVERGEGVETSQIKTSYSTAAGTAYVTFDNAKVPVENTLGPEGGGIFVILSNFNHERWVMTTSSARAQRKIVEECLKWITLASQAVIRSKVAAMIARNITHQMNSMSYKEQAKHLAGPIALLKMYATQTAQDTARDAVQISADVYHRTITFDSLLGGAEDVLGDLGVRQALRAMPRNAKL